MGPGAGGPDGAAGGPGLAEQGTASKMVLMDAEGAWHRGVRQAGGRTSSASRRRGELPPSARPPPPAGTAGGQRHPGRRRRNFCFASALWWTYNGG
jgi:hypothetical protein